jgi:hypothetical protein
VLTLLINPNHVKLNTDTEATQLSELNKSLQVMIALLLRSIPKDTLKMPLKEQIATLHNLGLRPTDIAAIVGKKSGHIRKELVAIRRSIRR